MSCATPNRRPPPGRAPRALIALLLAASATSGVTPDGPWACPSGHPVKGYRTQSGALVYFVPGTPFYDEASPDRCYASEEDARRDGARAADEGRPARPGQGELI